MTKAQLDKLSALTRGAAVLGVVGLGVGGGGALLGCDRSGSGDAPVAPMTETSVTAPALGSPSVAAPAVSAPTAEDASAAAVAPHRFPVPNAMPRNFDEVDAGTTPPRPRPRPPN